jgi:pyruvate dehydrogenase E2 component (dihydrolipoamide acetyltransferase)
MAAAITVPRRGWSMDEGTFAGWLKQDGDRVQPGEPLFVLESDKAAEEIESLDAGTLRIPPDAPRPGERVKVGQVLAYLVAAGETAPSSCGERQATSAAPLQQSQAAPEASRPTAAAPRHTRAISPRARRAAAELSVDWTNLQGSGRDGRIRERDVQAAAAGRPGGRLVPHTNGT